MPDVALSAGPTPLAALLSGGCADSHGTNPTASQGADPFAALLASKTAITKADVPTGTKAADAVAALLASAAPIVPTGPNPIAVAAKVPTAPALPIAMGALPVDSNATPAASTAKTKAKAGNDDTDTDSDSKDDDSDPLADAIASGATAVLAFAPVIVPPQAQDAPPVETAVRIDGPAAPRPLKLPIGPALPGEAAADAQVQVRARGDQTAAAQDPMNAEVARSDTQTSQQQPQQDSAADAEPATPQLSAEVAKAVVAALKQDDTNSSTVAQPAPTNGPTAAEAARIELQQKSQPQQQAAVEQAHRQAAPVLHAQARRTSEEAPAPRRAGDTRKRADVTPAETAAASLSQASDTRPTIGRPVTDVQAKGDAIIQHTLTIARDGAWLDKLAHDIASAGSGNDLHFKLEPQNLGALSVAIRQSDDGASIRLTADNQTTRDMLVDAQPRLIAEARAQGLKVSDTQIDVRQDQNHHQNQGSNQDAQRWAQNQAGQNGTSQNGQNRQSSPGHQPFVSNLARKADVDSESPERDSDARYA